MIDYYERLIGNHEVMYDLCIELLKFEGLTADYKKDRLHTIKKEIVNSGNYNRIKTAERIIKNVEESTDLSHLNERLAEKLRINIYSDKLDPYKEYIRELRSMGPKKYLIHCLSQIAHYKRCLKDEIEREKEKKNSSKEEKVSNEHRSINTTYEQKRSEANAPRVNRKEVIRTSSVPVDIKPITTIDFYKKDEVTLDDIIKNHIEERNIYLNLNEIGYIKRQFKIDKLVGRQGYLSDDTIQRLFKLRMMNELFDRNKIVSVISIVSAMDDIYGLALNEMDYQREYSKYRMEDSIHYENALNSIQNTNRDFVEEYTKLYEKAQKYLSKAPKEEQIYFQERVKSSNHIGSGSRLITPEEFRQKINTKAKTKIDDWYSISNLSVIKVVDEIKRYTKYMTVEELASYYHTIKLNKQGINEENLQKIFAYLIEDRMKDLEPNLSKETRNEFMKKRLVSATKEYLHEEPIFTDSRDIVTEKDYAKDRVESKEIIEKQEKKYFRQSKFKQAIQLMSFKKLKKLSEKEVLSKGEMESVKGMF